MSKLKWRNLVNHFEIEFTEVKKVNPELAEIFESELGVSDVEVVGNKVFFKSGKELGERPKKIGEVEALMRKNICCLFAESPEFTIREAA